jgi:Tellurite resistance protein TerB.
MIDCPHCHTAGRIAQIKYLTTQVERQKSELFTEVGDKAISIKKKNIQKHCISNVSSELIYENINGKIKDHTDNISSNLLREFQENLNLSKINYPLLLRAAISYQIIPVIKIEYKHFLTNETHSLIIVNFWDNPELIMTTNAEKLSIGIGSTFRYISNTFSKWFNTQGYKKKEDKRKEIKLMIYLIKADGIIAEEEKQFLSTEITSLSIFTNSEKKEFFNLMNSTTLPELVKEDVEFSSEEVKKEVLNKLEEIANVDGSFDTSEKMLIEKIRSL